MNYVVAGAIAPPAQDARYERRSGGDRSNRVPARTPIVSVGKFCRLPPVRS
ncbi:hypothetical protein NUV25_29785 [Burkholderia pseudomultivorans]|uniref:hypothetical protein n=1 Tax=Burkholderia pseudomultivorans TaxID=1207504 RepID=UPI00287451AE|nr:hypothetical protein [Burkholderia pseudomultivorans]MDS0861908.1 hypothetical protein [Burkholderia pseudomultivorans]